jgi:hypothetical protein
MGKWLTACLWQNEDDSECVECEVNGDHRHDMEKFNEWRGTTQQLIKECQEWMLLANTSNQFKTLGFLTRIISEALEVDAKFITIYNH